MWKPLYFAKIKGVVGVPTVSWSLITSFQKLFVNVVPRSDTMEVNMPCKLKISSMNIWATSHGVKVWDMAQK